MSGDALERTGWALALGGASVGLGLALVAWGSGGIRPLGIAGYGLIGTALGLAVIAGIGGPVWWLAGRRKWHGPVAAGVIGAGVAAIVTLLVLTQGFGLGLTGAAPGAVWASAAATALVAAFLGGLIGLAMWLVRYRP